MKWREVKILCAGMCVCTVIATGSAVWEKSLEKSNVLDEQLTENDETEAVQAENVQTESMQTEIVQTEIVQAERAQTEIIQTEIEERAEIERHKVNEVGDGTGVNENESNLVIADVTNYVNVRSMPSEEGEILGKLYNNSVGRMHNEESGWYYIESGSVKGYVKAEFVLIGEEAEKRAKEVGSRLAEVTTTTLKVRKEPTTESIVLGLVPGGDILNVLEEVEGWIKVDVEDGPGYVSTDYATVYTKNVEAESKEEEAARLEKEEKERKKAEAAAKEALKQQQAANKPSGKPSSGSQAGQGTENANGGGTGNGSGLDSGGNSDSSLDLGRQIADYAMKFIGNPYVYGGTSLTNGADCSGFVQSVYKQFGISLPRTSGEQGKSGRSVDGLHNAAPGDLIWYSGHIGIYIGNGKIVHASNPKNGIITSDATYRTILGIRRII